MTGKFKYRGNLAETPLPEMLHTIDRFRIPGIIEARQKDIVKRVFVRDGYIVHASSLDRADSLGDYLETLGTLEPKQLAKVKKERESSSKRFGVLCIEKGILSPVEVFESIRAQIENIVWSLFYWDQGEVTFGIGALTDDLMRSGDLLPADAELARRILQARFVTGERLTLSLVEGPFRHLNGEWLFQQLGDEGSKITLVLNFDFSSKVLSSAFRRGFTNVADHLVGEFSKRADAVYGACFGV